MLCCVQAQEANMFRVSGPTTGLLLSRQHSLLQLRDEDHAGQLDCARSWFRTVHARDPRLVAATLIMDTLGRAGASQTPSHAGAVVSNTALQCLMCLVSSLQCDCCCV